MNFGNIASLNQVYVPVSQRGGFNNMETAKAHRKVVKTAQELREYAEQTVEGLKSVDVADIDSTSSETQQDLAPEIGKVVMLADGENGEPIGVELSYNPNTGRANRLVSDLPNGLLTMGPDLGDESISPTFKWETPKAGRVETTYFKFDDASGTIAILDPDNPQPSILNGVDPGEFNSNRFITSPVTILPF